MMWRIFGVLVAAGVGYLAYKLTGSGDIAYILRSITRVIM